MKKRTIIAIIAVACGISVNAQNFGFGVNTKMCLQEGVSYGAKALSPSVQIVYELGAEPCFALEGSASFGVRYAEAEKHFSNNAGSRLDYVWEGMTCTADFDLYAKLVLYRFQIIGGIGYAYRQPTSIEDELSPVSDHICTWCCYGYSASGIKASTGVGLSLMGNLDLRAMIHLMPYTDSGKKVFKPGVEVGIIYYIM